MNEKNLNKYKVLLIHGGKLFAEHGFDKVTTRMIAQSASTPLSAIHYHFSNKETLYLEAFKYAYDKGNRVDFLEVLNENPTLLDSPQGQAEIIRTTVLRYFHTIFNPKRPSWETKLLIREIISPSAALPALAKTFMESTVSNTEKFCRLIHPEIDKDRAAIWADTLFSHAFLYILARKPIEMVRGKKWLNDGFYFKAAQMVARFMIQELGLPLPTDLIIKEKNSITV